GSGIQRPMSQRFDEAPRVVGPVRVKLATARFVMRTPAVLSIAPAPVPTPTAYTVDETAWPFRSSVPPETRMAALVPPRAPAAPGRRVPAVTRLVPKK